MTGAIEIAVHTPLAGPLGPPRPYGLALPAPLTALRGGQTHMIPIAHRVAGVRSSRRS
jgi:hypothetical protein